MINPIKKLNMKVIGSFTVAFVMVLCLNSCKKQKTNDPDLTFNQPLVNQKFNPGDSVKLNASIYDAKQILVVKWYVTNPNGDTIKTYDKSSKYYDLGTSFSIKDYFIPGYYNLPTGKYKWLISVVNNFGTKVFVREFLIKEDISSASNFTLAKLQNTSGKLETYLYNNTFKEIRNYRVSGRSNYYKIKSSTVFGKYIYYYDENTLDIRRFNGYDGSGEELVLPSPGLNPQFFAQKYLYITQANQLDNTHVYNKEGDFLFSIENHYSEPRLFLKVEDVIITGESGFLVSYSASTGNYISSSKMPTASIIYGIFSFEDKSKIYIATADPNNYNILIFWRYNSINQSMIKLNGSYEFSPLWQNPVNVSKTQAWLFSTSALYQFSSDEQVQKMNISAFYATYDIRDYEFHAPSNTLIYRTYNNENRFFNYSTKKNMGEIRGRTVLFLE